MRLLVFNPEHDYALAHGGSHYMAPASVRKIACSMETLPEIWCAQGDAILMNSSNRIVPQVSPKDITEVEPWGWDKAIRQRLLELGVKECVLPRNSFLENLRNLSHRRISISCNEFLNSTAVPKEFTDVGEAMSFFEDNPGCFFKLPWSSGGRGVVATHELNYSQTREWVAGAISRQSSVMAEFGVHNRILDFASLWNTVDGVANFEGWSVSLSDGRGKYNGNLYGPQTLMRKYILNVSGESRQDLLERDLNKYLTLQKDFIQTHIAPLYNGKIGIDMMIDANGIVYPCVEINIRRTMGHVAMDYFQNGADKIFGKKLFLKPVVGYTDLV